MAEPTPWQIAAAGQTVVNNPVVLVVFSRGTEPWPYAPHYVVVDNSANTRPPEYGVNTP